MMDDFLSKLNPQQRDAVTWCDGPQLVIAGAGSGKTRVLTYKIVYLLAHGYEPWRIMALTFTNKAAREMRERIEALVGHNVASRLWMGTFHSIFARILRCHADRLGFRPSFTIYDASDSKSLIKSIIRDMKLDEKIYKPSSVQCAISMAKNALMSPAMYAADNDLMTADRNARRPATVDIYRAYRQRCKIADAMDFDDLLYYTNVLMKENPDILNHYRDFFRYVLVDEYQDTNFAQHCIVTELCEKTDALTMVGDDAQSIYSFRGANIQNILNLEKAYPNLRIFKLEQNYRSTQTIVEAANTLIDKNRRQLRKHVFSENAVGDRIEVVNCYSEYEEAGMVAERIMRRKMRTGDSLDEFAILYRTNAQSRRLEEALRKRNIPYRIYGGLSFYQRKEVKDAISYFRMAVNPDDEEALRRIINYPARGIGETTVKKLVHAAIENNTSIWQLLVYPDKYVLDVNRGTARKLEAFRDLILDFVAMNDRGDDAATIAAAIISRTGMLTSLISDNTPENMSKQENLNEILNNVQEFVADRREEGDGEHVSMSDFIAEVSLLTDQDEKEEQIEQPKVTMMTAHAAKGLEFNNIIIVGVEDGLFPSIMSQDSIAQIEEERRLLYVAITRARNFCMMSYASSRIRNGQMGPSRPSPFLRDIDPRYLKLMQGTQIGDDRTADALNRYRDSYHSPTGFTGRYGVRDTGVTHGIKAPSGTLSVIDPKPRTDLPRPRPATPAHSVAPAISTASPANANAETDEFTRHSSDDLRIGMDILHERFGSGRIVDIEYDRSGDKIMVRFSGADQKKLMLRFARFKIL